MNNQSNQRAVTYSLLAHIRNSGKLSTGPMDIFVPIVKRALSELSKNGEFRGENRSEIADCITSLYALDIPVPVLNSLLRIIESDVNCASTNQSVERVSNLFSLYDDGSFYINNYIFDEFDERHNEYKQAINNIDKLFKVFCDINDAKQYKDDGIIHFIECNKTSLSCYLAGKSYHNTEDNSIVAKFINHFKAIRDVYEIIREIYLGAILSCYLEFKPIDVKLNIDLLLDTNLIVSLFDLNTSESTKTCTKLLDISKELGLTLHVLQDTIEETKNLLRGKANNFQFSIMQKYINKEDIYNACERRDLKKADLERIIDSLESNLLGMGVTIVPYTEKLKNKAKFSSEYTKLKQVRSSSIAALHDATCLYYVKEKRTGVKITDFLSANCWFVNNAITHDYNNGIHEFVYNCKREKVIPEIIKVDDLINILWLATPSLSVASSDDIAEIGLSSLVAYSLNKSLPKSKIIKELDDNIQKYRSEDITDRDILLLSMRIADGQVQDIEGLNTLCEIDVSKFNEGVKAEAAKQEEIEANRSKLLEEQVVRLEKSINSIQKHHSELTRQGEEIQAVYEKKMQKADKDIAEANRKRILSENNFRKHRRAEFINKRLREWRRPVIIIAVTVACIAFSLFVYSFMYFNSIQEADLWYKQNDNFYVSFGIGFILSIIDIFVIKDIYNKYQNNSNINAYISRIEIPEDLKEINE